MCFNSNFKITCTSAQIFQSLPVLIFYSIKSLINGLHPYTHVYLKNDFL